MEKKRKKIEKRKGRAKGDALGFAEEQTTEIYEFSINTDLKQPTFSLRRINNFCPVTNTQTRSQAHPFMNLSFMFSLFQISPKNNIFKSGVLSFCVT